MPSTSLGAAPAAPTLADMADEAVRCAAALRLAVTGGHDTLAFDAATTLGQIAAVTRALAARDWIAPGPCPSQCSVCGPDGCNPACEVCAAEAAAYAKWAESRSHDCPRDRFLEDPITTSYGVGSEMVHLIPCPVCDAEEASR